MDTNHDGHISFTGQRTLPSLCRYDCGPRFCGWSHIQERNADGIIEEFQKFVKHTERELQLLFDSIDRNHDGSLDKDEIASAFRQAGLTVSNAKLDAFFDKIDTNHDGHLSFEEWR
jgi:solute carrier family 25 phosphate transporter 23/24/25/41